GGGDFVTTMLRLESERDTVNVVDDQWGSPTFACDLAEGLLRLAARLASGDGALEGAVLNATGGGRATWHDLAAEAFALAGADRARVLPVGTDEFPRPATRPSFSVLGDSEWRRAGLLPLPHWRDGLRRAFTMAR
ncbi:MAG TPA: NAD(P)-dependent oxidoreductase, partial [Dietzia timorensis]